MYDAGAQTPTVILLIDCPCNDFYIAISHFQERNMPISKDFQGYDLLVRFIEEVKAGQHQTSKIKIKIRSNKVLKKMFGYMNEDMKISFDEYLAIITNAFSEDGLESNLEKSRFPFIEKIYEYCSNNWHQIEETVSFLKQVDIKQKMYSMVKKYLPKVIEPVNITIYFVLDGGDCRGFRGEVYADITLLAILGKTKAIGLLAHEFHHSCRAEMAVPYEEDHFSEIFQVLFWLESEGIADKVYDLGAEKPDNEFEPLLKLRKTRRQIYSNARNYLMLFDKAVQKLENPVPIFSNNSYHPVGHFMADVIESTFGTSELVKTVGDPFNFLETYNNSAKILRKPEVFVLSDETIRRLGEIRAKTRKTC